MRAVENCGCDRWYELGRNMGITDAVLNGETQGISSWGKVEKLFAIKEKVVGFDDAAKSLLKACKDKGIYGGFEDELKRSGYSWLLN